MASVDKITLLSSTALTDNATGTAQALELKQRDFVAYISATAVNGATTVAAKVQHSADGTNLLDAVTFTSIAGATGREAKAFTIPLMPYVRATVTLTGATKAATVAIDLFFDKG
jgi:hypothetical protein